MDKMCIRDRNDTRAGMLHVANHHISPGKKQWTWGNGDFGRAWDRNLTDEDGPYIELMAGVYTENQPDFTWLQPYEEKSFVQYFLPYRELGVVKNASRDLLMNIEPEGEDSVRFKIFATSCQTVNVVLKGEDGKIYYSKEVTITPEELLDETVKDVYKRQTMHLSCRLSPFPKISEQRRGIGRSLQKKTCSTSLLKMNMVMWY